MRGSPRSGTRKSAGITTYSGVHLALRRKKGPASTHACKCGEQADEWAYLHGAADERLSSHGVRFSIDLNQYEPMCYSCHRKYDKAHIVKCPHGHEYTPENTLMDAGKRKCKTCVYDRNRKRHREIPMTEEQHQRKLELQRKRRAAETPEQHRAMLDRSNQLRRAQYVKKSRSA